MGKSNVLIPYKTLDSFSFKDPLCLVPFYIPYAYILTCLLNDQSPTQMHAQKLYLCIYFPIHYSRCYSSAKTMKHRSRVDFRSEWERQGICETCWIWLESAHCRVIQSKSLKAIKTYGAGSNGFPLWKRIVALGGKKYSRTHFQFNCNLDPWLTSVIISFLS